MLRLQAVIVSGPVLDESVRDHIAPLIEQIPDVLPVFRNGVVTEPGVGDPPAGIVLDIPVPVGGLLPEAGERGCGCGDAGSSCQYGRKE